MAMQIISAKVVDKEVVFEKGNRGVNLTEILRKLSSDYFVEKSYFEEDEEVFYKTMDFETVKKFLTHLIETENKTWEELKNAKGNTLRDEKINQIRDYSLVKNQVMEMLLQNCEDSNKILALI